jgi:hypothetical protein
MQFFAPWTNLATMTKNTKAIYHGHAGGNRLAKLNGGARRN